MHDFEKHFWVNTFETHFSRGKPVEEAAKAANEALAAYRAAFPTRAGQQLMDAGSAASFIHG